MTERTKNEIDRLRAKVETLTRERDNYRVCWKEGEQRVRREMDREQRAILSEAERLRGWLRAMRRLPEVSITNIDGPPEHSFGREIPTAYIDAAIRGDAPPKGGKAR